MSNKLRQQLIRTAHANPDLRPLLLPLVAGRTAGQITVGPLDPYARVLGAARAEFLRMTGQAFVGFAYYERWELGTNGELKLEGGPKGDIQRVTLEFDDSDRAGTLFVYYNGGHLEIGSREVSRMGPRQLAQNINQRLGG